MSDAGHEADDAVFRVQAPRVRQDLVAPQSAPNPANGPIHENDEAAVAVQLDPNDTIARIRINPASETRGESHHLGAPREATAG